MYTRECPVEGYMRRDLLCVRAKVMASHQRSLINRPFSLNHTQDNAFPVHRFLPNSQSNRYSSVICICIVGNTIRLKHYRLTAMPFRNIISCYKCAYLTISRQTKKTSCARPTNAQPKRERMRERTMCSSMHKSARAHSAKGCPPLLGSRQPQQNLDCKPCTKTLAPLCLPPEWCCPASSRTY